MRILLGCHRLRVSLRSPWYQNGLSTGTRHPNARSSATPTATSTCFQPSPWCCGAILVALLFACPPGVFAQERRDPHIGYAYPGGGQQGTSFEITVGGEALTGVSAIHVTGTGVKGEVLEHTKPLTQKQFNDLGQKLKELREQMKDGFKRGTEDAKKAQAAFKTLTESLGLKDLDIEAFLEMRKKLNNPNRQANPQIAETVRIRITVAAGAEAGRRELRLKTPTGLTNPTCFQIGQYAECSETEPNEKPAELTLKELPVTVNGQIMPGDVDRFRFKARKGQGLVAIVSARELIPYLADAVPGWFQAIVALYDAQGREVAYQDDFRFNPDPVLYYEVPEDGEYVLEIRDSIYRGREDFVYRITLGEVPFIASIFPLGGRVGAKTAVELTGWNLPAERTTIDPGKDAAGTIPVFVKKNKLISNSLPFAVDGLPEVMECEPNDQPFGSQKVEFPVMVNGRISKPGGWDIFRFEGRAGTEISAEIVARRLESPLDSMLWLTDGDGKQIAVNDDEEDRGAGLTTHHADSRLVVKLPADGTYLVHVGDTQRKGGPAYAYRLRLAPTQPDFELRVVPSRINAMAGSTIPIAVHALRKDGFAGEIELRLKNAPAGTTLGGARIPAGQNAIRITMTVPPQAAVEPVAVALEGYAEINGKTVRRTAVPAEDMMQAFLYRHLVPMSDWILEVTGSRKFGPGFRIASDGLAKIPAGGTTRVRVSAFKGPFFKQVRLELDEPPEGIAIKEVADDPAGLAIVLTADAAKVKPGQKGNLIVNIFFEVAPADKDGKPGQKRNFPIGVLPAIPYEITAP